MTHALMGKLQPMPRDNPMGEGRLPLDFTPYNVTIAKVVPGS